MDLHQWNSLSIEAILEMFGLSPDDVKMRLKGPPTCIGGCGGYFPQSAPNLPDGTFKCWSCRNP